MKNWLLNKPKPLSCCLSPMPWHTYSCFYFCQAPRCILKTLDEECRFPQVGISVTQNSHILVDISLASCVQGFRFKTLSWQALCVNTQCNCSFLRVMFNLRDIKGEVPCFWYRYIIGLGWGYNMHQMECYTKTSFSGACISNLSEII